MRRSCCFSNIFESDCKSRSGGASSLTAAGSMSNACCFVVNCPVTMEHQPPYNRALKRDNSGFAYLQFTTGLFPRLAEHYRHRSDLSRG